jgi:tRNA(Leu) C34 or U34 (ribose-2'-O)-methylase TrmL
MEGKGKVYIGLTNPKSPTNVGAVLRAVGCFYADEVLYTGERFNRAVKFNTDTKNIKSIIPLTQVEDFIEYSKNENINLVCVDLIEGAVPLTEFVHPENALYVFGPEDGTISQAVIDKAYASVYVPTKGCLNLAASVNVLLYDRLTKSNDIAANDELIKKSRDTNNTVKARSMMK